MLANKNINSIFNFFPPPHFRLAARYVLNIFTFYAALAR